MNEKINLVMESEIKRVFPITQYTSGVVLDTYLDDYTIPENATVYFSAKTESGKQFKYECEYKDNMVTVPVSL